MLSSLSPNEIEAVHDKILKVQGMESAVMTSDHTKTVLDHFLKFGTLVGHGNGGGLVLYINAPLGAVMMRDDGGCFSFHPSASYNSDCRIENFSIRSPSYRLHYQYPNDWVKPFYEKFVPDIVSPEAALERLLRDNDDVNNESGRITVWTLLANTSGSQVLLALMGLALIIYGLAQIIHDIYSIFK